jgi:hypothetical protein
MCDDFELANPSSSQLEDYAFEPTPTEAATGVYPFGIAELNRIKQERADALNEAASETSKRRREREMAQVDPSPYLLPDPQPDYQTDEGVLVERPLVPQSGLEVQADAENTVEPSAPMAMESDQTLGNNALDPTDGSMSVYFGESVTSFRQALKRYNYHTTFGQLQIGDRYYKRRQNNLPYYRGFNEDGIHSAFVTGIGSQPYNRCKTTLMNWVIPAYAGWRGATRWKIAIEGHVEDLMKTAYMSVQRQATDLTGYEESFAQWIAMDTANDIAYTSLRNKPHTWDGSTVSFTSVNPAIEYELPYYSTLRFMPAKKRNLTTSVGNANFHDFQTVTALDNGGGMHFDSYCSTGEDFNLFFFTGAPIVYYYGPDDPQP